ncbi:MAG: ABC transporter substrate-binding protein [Dehalococcoidia bacterium]|nr:ABC transporter substrate-binding protein [Dehalococcoidia bacterium]
MDQRASTKLDRRTFLKLSVAAGGAIVVGLPLSSCAPGAGLKAVFEGQTGGVGITSTVNHAAFHIGEAKGFFAEEGVKNILTEFQGGSDVVRGLTDGGMHWPIPAVSPSVSAFMQGAPIRIIAGQWAAASTIAYAVKPDSPYKSIQDLKGKKIGYSRPASLSQFFALKAIRAAGLNEKDFNLVAVGGAPESRTALMTGVVDASWQVDSTAVQGTLDNSLRVLFWAHELVKDWQETVVAARPDFIKENSDVLKRFLRAYQKTMDWETNNLDEAAKIWANAIQIDLNVATQLMKASPKTAFTTKLNPIGLQVAEESMREFKLIDKPVPWKDLVDQSMLPKELQVTLPG